MTKKLYKDLGVPEDASSETIKKAYHKKVQKAHPDKGGTKCCTCNLNSV